MFFQIINAFGGAEFVFSSGAELQLGTMLLSGDNFINWSRSVKMALGAKNKLGFIDGSSSKPSENSPDLNK
ncbi:hypothetical protein AgCh_039920 [Apium graveolens]